MGEGRRRLEVALEGRPVPMDPDTPEGRLERAEARIRALELAVEALDRRIPRAPAGPTKSVFGVEVTLAAGVDDAAVRSAVEELPAGLSGDDVVEHLEDLGMLARAKGRRG